MAPYKLEDNIREKLEARELKPSANAWEKLETKLQEKQPKKKTVVWYYVAASFIGFLILASVFLNRNNSEVNNQIVNETTDHNKAEKKVEIIPNNSTVQEIASEEKISEKVEAKTPSNETEKKKNSNPVQLKPLSPKKSEIDKKIEKKEVIAKTSNEEKSKPQITIKPTISEEEKLFNSKVDEVVASVKTLQKNNTEVTVAEVETLLKNARREIETKRILNSPKVDATALLQDVEWELEKSFRDKVFDALGDGFNKIRTAVTERND